MMHTATLTLLAAVAATGAAQVIGVDSAGRLQIDSAGQDIQVNGVTFDLASVCVCVPSLSLSPSLSRCPDIPRARIPSRRPRVPVRAALVASARTARTAYISCAPLRPAPHPAAPRMWRRCCPPVPTMVSRKLMCRALPVLVKVMGQLSTLTSQVFALTSQLAAVDPLLANLTRRAEAADERLRNLSVAVDQERTDLDVVLQNIFSALSNPPSTSPTAIPTTGPSIAPSTGLPSASPSGAPTAVLDYLGHHSMGNLYQQRNAIDQHNAMCRSR